jgi:hypothetical protein|tara:strand:- start:851 stop:1051 length:201 start_codon:yes stop_codon:yes gene_type:complete
MRIAYYRTVPLVSKEIGKWNIVTGDILISSTFEKLVNLLDKEAIQGNIDTYEKDPVIIGTELSLPV